MAVLPIRMAGDPVLRQKAKKVPNIDASIRKLVADMIETMRDAPGVGLAANQIGVALRVVVIEVPSEDEPEDEETPPARELHVLINPQIVKRSGERRLDEGCLSIPGYHAAVPRSANVTAKGLDLDGREVRLKAQDNLLAEAIEHEIDHLNGVLYIDHLESTDELVKIGEDEEDEEEKEGRASKAPASGSEAQVASGKER